MSNFKLINLFTFFGLIFLFVCAGCVDKSADQAGAGLQVPEEYPLEGQGEMSPDGYYLHTVKYPDESISIIAKWFTGDLRNWEVLAKSNPDLNPNRIFLGDTIKIPRNIMITQAPLTAKFVEDSQPHKKRKKAKAKLTRVETAPVTDEPAEEPAVEPAVEESAEDDEPLLFGPKGYSKDS